MQANKKKDVYVGAAMRVFYQTNRGPKIRTHAITLPNKKARSYLSSRTINGQKKLNTHVGVWP